jgi:hypothetical protein
MILYELRCGAGHGFEAWFRNADTYDQQHAGNQIACPVCGDSGVSKAPMAPRIARKGRNPEPAAQPSPDMPAQPTPPSIHPDQVRLVMSRIAALNRQISETCDYVGNDFAEEARKIHYGETEHRDIYGETSPSEAVELQEEGIEIAAIPWIRRGDN